MADTEQHVGWAVAMTAYRDSGDKIQLRTRAYCTGTFHRDDAEQYARDETEKLFPTADGWVYQISVVRVCIPMEIPNE